MAHLEKIHFTAKANRTLGRLGQRTLASIIAVAAMAFGVLTYAQTGPATEPNLADAQFQELWKARLGFVTLPSAQRKHWATIKALNRRVALSMDNGEYAELRPIAELVGRLSESIARFLDKPLAWHGPADELQRQGAEDKIRRHVFQELHKFVAERLVARPLPEWLDAFELSGRYSTFVRAQNIRDIVEQAAPVPTEAMSHDVSVFLRDLRSLVRAAVREAGGRFVSEEADVTAGAERTFRA